VIITGSAQIPEGELGFEKALQFQPGDPTGLWNVRVIIGDHVLIDRPFVVESSRPPEPRP
jgi:hypothetical protein